VAKSVETARLARFLDAAGAVDWTTAERWLGSDADLADSPPSAAESPSDAGAGARFAPAPGRAQKPASYEKWAKDLAVALARTETLRLLRSRELGLESLPGESERDFRARLAEAARERRDARVAKVRERFEPKLAAADERVRRAEARVESEKQQAESQKWGTVMAGAASVAGVLFGRKRISATNVGRFGTAVRSLGRSSKEAGDVQRATETLAAERARRAELDAQLQTELAAIETVADAHAEPLETVELRPRRGDVEIRRVVLAWIPDIA
jgi:hypothetical protein